ncbi:MAG: hypothetical protein HY062_17340 [Bacteroidetes bacterium]|nr:hypothetical protein [Bacteroidota bacterium]
MKYFYTLFVFLCLSCEIRTAKDCGLNDLVVGVQQFIMYENGEFILELGLGGVDGKYEIKGDTVYLDYDEDLDDGWPNKIVITKKYFITIPNTGRRDTVKISRYARNTDL